jgi:hypothetical protein
MGRDADPAFTACVRFHAAYGGFTSRQIDTSVAHWVLGITSVHLGLCWRTLVGVARKLTSIPQPNGLRALALRPMPIPCRDPRVYSSLELAISTEFAMRCRSSGGFRRSRRRFFFRCVAIAGPGAGVAR